MTLLFLELDSASGRDLLPAAEPSLLLHHISRNLKAVRKEKSRG